MKILNLFLLLWGTQVLAAEDLNYQLTQAAANDNLQEAIRLLDLGADPLKPGFWNGWPFGPSMHISAMNVLKTGKDQVYKEFLKRGIQANALAKLNGQSVWNYIIASLDEECTYDKLERFFLRSLADGANPFPQGPDSGQLYNLIILELDKVVSEIIHKGVSKTSGLQRPFCENNFLMPKNFYQWEMELMILLIMEAILVRY